MFAWYWLADLCEEQQNIAFVLGHALYMKAIHGGKAKNDRIDADKIARLLRGGKFPLAYVYPRGMRETRDLLRRRMYIVNKRAELIDARANTQSSSTTCRTSPRNSAMPPTGRNSTFPDASAMPASRRAPVSISP